MDLIRKICKNWYVQVEIPTINIEENSKLSLNSTNISGVAYLKRASQKFKTIQFSGTGSGIVDALFSTLIVELEKEYISLRGLYIKDFSVCMAKSGQKVHNADAKIIVSGIIKNIKNYEFVFNAGCLSLLSGCVRVVIHASEQFINAEIATLQLKRAIKDAEKRYRSDLVEKYTLQLSEIMKVSCYKELFLKDEQ